MELEKNTARIRHICAFLSKGGGTLQEMLDWVNRRLENNGDREIGQRVLETCISKLRKGDFEHSRRDEEVKKGQSMFPVVVIDKKYYRWDPALKEFPIFGSLDEDERFTLPFLVGILERYKSIPSVLKILEELPGIFNVDKKDMESSSAIIHGGAMMYDNNNDRFQEALIQCVIKILSHISMGDWIEFNYSKVHENRQITSLHEVAPLQIRLYENYYYLIATDKKQKKVLQFRVDQIHRLRVDLANQDDEVFQNKFNRKELEHALDLKSRFNNTLGVWIHHANDSLHEIDIEFTDWAASYIRHLKFHPSQQVISEDEQSNKIVIRFKLLMSPESNSDEETDDKSVYKEKSRNFELSFLLGRFRGFAKVLSVRPA